MSIKIIDTLAPLGRFPAVNAKDVEVEAESKRLDEVIAELEAGKGGTKKYPDLENKPQINGFELNGNKSSAELGINIPTKVSELQNDSGFLMHHQDISGKADKSDVDTALNAKADKSELNYKANKSDVDTALSTKASKADLDAANQVIAANTEAITSNANAIGVERARIDNLIGVVPAGSEDEIADGRVGADGKTYGNIGGAIRGQVTDLKSDIKQLGTRTNLFDKAKCVLGYSLSRTVGDKFAPVETAGYFYLNEKFAVKTGDVIRSNSNYNVYVLYDSDDFVIKSIETNTNYNVTVPEVPNGTYMRIYHQTTFAHYENFAFNINGYLPETDVDYNKNMKSVSFERAKSDLVKEYMLFVNMLNPNDILLDTEVITDAPSCAFRKTAGKFMHGKLFEVKYGDTVYVHNSWCGFLFYDENNEYVGRYAPQGEKKFTVSFEKAKKMRYYGNGTNTSILVATQMISINRELPENYVPYGIYASGLDKNSINKISEEVNVINSKFKKRNLFDKSKAIVGYSLSRTVGAKFEPIESSGYFYYPVITYVKTGDIIRANSSYNIYVLYDENDVVIKAIDTGADFEVTIPEIPANTHMRLYHQCTFAHYENFAFNINGYLPETDVDYGKNFIPAAIDDAEKDNVKQYTEYVNMLNPNDVVLGTEVITDAPSCAFRKTEGKFMYSKLFDVKYGDTVYVHNSWCGFLFYNENNSYLGRYAPQGEKEFTVSFENAKKMRYYGNAANAESILVSGQMISINRKLPSEYVPYGVKEVDRLAEEIEGGETSNPCSFSGDDITAFTKIICVGDSLTQGGFNIDGDEGYRTYDKYSYPRSLERLTGVSVTNKGHGGLTSLEYWNAHKNDDFSGHDVAIVELGTNDYWRYGSSWTQNSIDGMTNIINKLKTENKGIFIFVTTIPQVQAYQDNRVLSPKIKSFVEGLNDDHVICLDITTYGHTDESIGYNCQHLSAYGYNRLARDIKSYISWYMNKHREVFRKIQFIGTDDTYTD